MEGFQIFNAISVHAGDLDNDGDLDLVINNLHDNAGIYQNNSQNNFSKITLKGPANNLQGIGAKVIVRTKEKTQIQELYTNRGFESSVSPNLVFGIGNETTIDEIAVIWPDRKTSIQKNPTTNTTIAFEYSKATNTPITIADYSTQKSQKNSLISSKGGISFEMFSKAH